MSFDSVLLAYQDRLQQIQAALSLAHSRQHLMAALLGASLLLVLAFGFVSLARRTLPVWCSPLPVTLAVVCSRRYSRHKAMRSTLGRLGTYYTRGIARLQDQWAGHGDTGLAYAVSGHVYASDLNLFGTGSLFERLCTARTELGKRKLAAYLQHQHQPLAELEARQAAVRELRNQTDLREELATLGSQFHEATAATTAWLEREPAAFPTWMRLLALISPLAILGACASLVLAPHLLPLAAFLLVAQGLFGWMLRPRVRAIIEPSRAVYSEISLVRAGLQLLVRQEFTSAKLTGLHQRVMQERAVHQLRVLERYLKILEERSKDSFYVPSLVLMTGTHCAMAIEAWRTRHRAAFLAWLDAWAEFEALNALACYAYERPGDSFPEWTPHAVTFDAEALGHPLIPAATCVRNDIRLDSNATRTLVISGSNMAGKSTLMRSIGISLVLASAGAPVRARRLILSPFSLCASLSIQDALGEGKSRFMAEVDRLRASIDLATAHPPLLFLIDEIFSGTNSRDRRIAAEAVVRTLVSKGALGAISTHDLALTEIADLPEVHGANVHMGSRSTTDPLDFDFLLKPGVTREANALAIARLAGVPV